MEAFVAISYEDKDNILLLLLKVEEVLNNNDWPTEEGYERADEPPCVIRKLVDTIRRNIDGSNEPNTGTSI